MTKAPDPGTLTADPASGLEGVVAAHTGLSDVDGLNGQLVLRGKRIEDLAGKVWFEDAILHLWHSYVFCDADELRKAMGDARQAAFSNVPLIEASSGKLSTYERMQLGLAALTLDPGLPQAVTISGALPVFLAAACRVSQGEPPIAPDPNLTTAEDLLRMMGDEEPDAEHIAALDRYLVTILDHGLECVNVHRPGHWLDGSRHETSCAWRHGGLERSASRRRTRTGARYD